MDPLVLFFGLLFTVLILFFVVITVSHKNVKKEFKEFKEFNDAYMKSIETEIDYYNKLNKYTDKKTKDA
jgi:hypothetical protein